MIADRRSNDEWHPIFKIYEIFDIFSTFFETGKIDVNKNQLLTSIYLYIY